MKADATLNRGIYLQDPEDKRFRTIAWLSILLYAAMGVVVGLVKVPAPSFEEAAQLPPRIAKLIIPKPQAPPQPEPPKEQAEEKKAEATKPKEEPKPEVEVASKPPVSAEELADEQRKKNLEIAMNSGLLKLLKQSDTDPSQDKKLKKAFSQVKGLDTASRNMAGLSIHSASTGTDGIDDIVSKLEKSIKNSGLLVDKSASAGSGGINQMIGNLPTEVGTTALKDRKTTAVESPFQIKGFEDGKSPRSYESIAQVVESYKGGVSFLYNKSLRDNPTLRGTVTVEFIIAGSGEVIDCRVVSSSMKNVPFEEALIKRILQWKFPAVSAGDVTIVYPLIFSVAG